MLNDTFGKRFGIGLFRPHTGPEEAFQPWHRFMSFTASGLYGLAKDLVCPVVEQIDTAALQRLVPPPQKEKWGSLKSLEKVLATIIGAQKARTTLGPLHGIYNLRLADAHVASKNLDAAYSLVEWTERYPLLCKEEIC